MVTMTDLSAVIVAHSFGGLVWQYFLQWVTENVHKNWVNDHIQDVIYVGVPLLGMPKALHALVSGDTREFQELGGGFAMVVNSLFSKKTRASMWRSWGSIFMCLPHGDEAVWGVSTIRSLDQKNLTWDQSMDLLRGETPAQCPADIYRLKDWLFEGVTGVDPPEHRRRHHHGSTYNTKLTKEDEFVTRPNVLASSLPFAPDMRMWALYGTGIQTEYTVDFSTNVFDKSAPRYVPVSGSWQLGDGDGSVPLTSLGYMCARGEISKK